MMLMSAAMQGGVQSGAGLTGAAGAVPEAAKLVGGALPDVKPSGGGAGLGGAGISAGLGQAPVGGLDVGAAVVAGVDAGAPGQFGNVGAGRGRCARRAAMTGVAGAPMGSMPMMPMPMGTGGGMPGGMMGRGGASPHVVQNRPSVVPRVGIG